MIDLINNHFQRYFVLSCGWDWLKPTWELTTWSGWTIVLWDWQFHKVKISFKYVCMEIQKTESSLSPEKLLLQTALLQPRYVLALIISRICTFKPPPWSVSQTFVLCHTWSVIQIFKNSNKQISIISTLTGGGEKKKRLTATKKNLLFGVYTIPSPVLL